MIEFLRNLLRLRRYKWKSVEVAVFRRGWVTFGEYLTGKGHRPPTTVGVRKQEWLPFCVVAKHPQSIIYFCHNSQYMHLTDGGTERWTELGQQYRALHYMQSNSKKWKYITYRNAASGGTSHGHRGSAHKISWRSVWWFQRYAHGQIDTETHRQTHTQTDKLIAILRSPTVAE